jgi:hypothetical protein
LSALDARGLTPERIATAQGLGDHYDVESGPPLDGETVVWVDASSEWQFQTAGGGGTLGGLSDVVLTSPATGALLMYDGANWIDATTFTGSGYQFEQFTKVKRVGAFSGFGIEVEAQAAGFEIKTWGITTYSNSITHQKAGGTEASPTVVDAGHWFGFHDFTGYDGTTFVIGARMIARPNTQWADATPGPAEYGTKVYWQTTEGASTTLVTRVEISEEQETFTVFRAQDSSDPGGSMLRVRNAADSADLFSVGWDGDVLTASTITSSAGTSSLNALTLTTDLAPAHGGTGLSDPTSGRLLVTAGASAMTLLAPGADGTYVRASGGAWVVSGIAGADISGKIGIDDLTDVTITSVGANEVLGYSSGWINRTLGEAGISAVGHTHGKADIPAAVAYEDEANTFAAAQQFDSTVRHTNVAELWRWDGDGAGPARMYLTWNTTPNEWEWNIVPVSGTDPANPVLTINSENREWEFDDGKLLVNAISVQSASGLTSGTLDNARVTEGNVTQHGTAVFAARDVGDIGNVTITSIGAGELLEWSGSAWINQTLAELGIPSLPIAASDVTSGTFATTVTTAGYQITRGTTGGGVGLDLLYNATEATADTNGVIFRIRWTDEDMFTVTDAGTMTAATNASFAGSGAGLTSIPETAITDGSVLARLAANETVAGNWTYDGTSDFNGDVRTDAQLRVHVGVRFENEGGDLSGEAGYQTIWGIAGALKGRNGTGAVYTIATTANAVVTNPSSAQTITHTLTTDYLAVDGPAATTGPVNKDSPAFRWVGSYWDGLGDQDITWDARVYATGTSDDEPDSSWRLTVGDPAGDRFEVDSIGNAIIRAETDILQTLLVVSENDASGNWSGVEVHNYGAGGTPYFQGNNARGTEASPTASLSGDVLTGYYGAGRINASSWGGFASMQMRAAENFGASNRGTRIVFTTTDTGGDTVDSAQWQIEPDGDLYASTDGTRNIGSASGNRASGIYALNLLAAGADPGGTGKIRTDGNVIATGVQSRFGPGAATAIFPSNVSLSVIGNWSLVGSHATADNAQKLLRIGAMHYDRDDLPLLVIMGDSQVSNSIVYIGGGTSAGNAMEEMRLYTAADTSTPTGTLRQRHYHSGTIEVYGNDAAFPSLQLYTYAADYSIRFRRVQGTRASPTAITSGLTLGTVRFDGAINTTPSFATGAQIASFAQGAWSGSANGAEIVFSTVDSGTTALDARWRIQHNGHLAPFDDDNALDLGQPTLRIATIYTDNIRCGTTTEPGQIYHETEYNNGDKSAAFTIDWTLGNAQRVRLTNGSSVLASFTNPSGPCSLVLRILADGTQRALTYDTDILWLPGAAPTLPTTNNSWIVVTFYFDGTKYSGNWSAPVGP